MLPRLLILISLCALTCAYFNDEDDKEVFNKPCRDVDSSLCTVHGVRMDPCPHGPRYCTLKTDERYSINIDFTPYFTFEDVRVAVSSDHGNMRSFSPITMYKNACRGVLPCPIGGQIRHSYNIPFTMDKRTPGKFPIQVMLWNGLNENEVCCFTFRAKVN